MAEAVQLRLLTCSEAATSVWLMPPFATARRTLLCLLMGISPLRGRGTPDRVHGNGCQGLGSVVPTMPAIDTDVV